MNLHKTNQSQLRTEKGIEVLHVGSQRFVRVRGVRDRVEVPHKVLLFNRKGQIEVFQYHW